MKQFYLYSLLLTGVFSSAQIVNIPDANFKNKLVNSNCASLSPLGFPNTDVDTNDDGEIQETEAAAIYHLSIQPGQIASIDGISHFTNLLHLSIPGNLLTEVDLSGMSNLKTVSLYGNQINFIMFNNAIESIDLSYNQLTNMDFINGLTNLHSIAFNDNFVSIVNFNNLPALQDIECWHNLLTSLDLTGLHVRYLTCDNNLLTSLILCPEIADLFCNNNQLSNLNLSMIDIMKNLGVANNQLTSLELPPFDTYASLDISGNLFTSLNISSGEFAIFQCDNTMLTSLTVPSLIAAGGGALSISGNQNLVYIDAKTNGSIIAQIENNPNLELVCVNDYNLSQSLLEYLRFHNNDGLILTSYCSFNPGGQYNTITGTIRYDFDSNGCDISDAPAIGTAVGLAIGSSGILGNTFADESGNYTAYGGLTQTLSPQFQNPYYAITPASYVANFVGFGNTQTFDFCIAPNGIHPDLEISLIPIIPARPGSDATYKIHVENKGTETQSGGIAIVFDDARTDFVSANPIVESQSTNVLTWNLTNLTPFSSHEITFTVNVNSPTETPAVNNGDILNFTASIDSGADETPSDNMFEFAQTVVGSFDPNDKAVSRQTVDITEIDEYLYYTVRFQNLGTFAAENVVVKDTLSSNLDLSTLQMVSASHPYRSTLTQTNKLEFFFEGINLPIEADNELASHGYVTYKIKPKSNLFEGAIIENTAEVYFDFNLPVVTNTVVTNIVSLGNPQFANEDFVIYPNPTKNEFTIDLKNSLVKNIGIYNAIGQLVKTVKTQNDRQVSVDISDLNSGTYFVKIESDKGKSCKKLIKY